MPSSRPAALGRSTLRIAALVLGLRRRRWSWERDEEHHLGRLFGGVRRPPWFGATASCKRERENRKRLRRRESKNVSGSSNSLSLSLFLSRLVFFGFPRATRSVSSVSIFPSFRTDWETIIRSFSTRKIAGIFGIGSFLEVEAEPESARRSLVLYDPPFDDRWLTGSTARPRRRACPCPSSIHPGVRHYPLRRSTEAEARSRREDPRRGPFTRKT